MEERWGKGRDERSVILLGRGFTRALARRVVVGVRSLVSASEREESSLTPSLSRRANLAIAPTYSIFAPARWMRAFTSFYRDIKDVPT